AEISGGEVSWRSSQKDLNAKRCALAVKWIQIANARQPLALTLPLKSLGGRHAPLAARVLAYTSSLTRKTGQCRLLPSRPGEFPPASHRSGLDTLASSGSCHRTKAAAFR